MFYCSAHQQWKRNRSCAENSFGTNFFELSRLTLGPDVLLEINTLVVQVGQEITA